MRRFYFLLMMVMLTAGCSEKKEEAKFQGVTTKHDYRADGMNYLKKSDIAKAIQSFDQAIRQDPRNSENYITLGEVYMRLKQFNRAVDTFSGAVQIDPNNGDAFYLLAVSHDLQATQVSTPQSVEECKKRAVLAAQRSIEIFMQKRDEEKFKRSVAFLKQLNGGLTAVQSAPPVKQ